jgi:hypothetical protein
MAVTAEQYCLGSPRKSHVNKPNRVERVARAICSGDPDAWVEAARCRNWEQYIDAAKRAIKACN